MSYTGGTITKFSFLLIIKNDMVICLLYINAVSDSVSKRYIMHRIPVSNSFITKSPRMIHFWFWTYLQIMMNCIDRYNNCSFLFGCISGESLEGFSRMLTIFTPSKLKKIFSLMQESFIRLENYMDALILKNDRISCVETT